MVELGVPSWRQRRFRHRAKPGQGGGRAIPRRAPAGHLGLRSPGGTDGLGQKGPSGLPRPSHARCPIRHVDAGDDIFAPGVKSLLQDACAIGRRRPQLADATLRSYTRKLDDKLDALLRLSPKGSQGDKLKRMVKKFRQYFFVFVTNRDVPPTNNGSEQAIRPCVIFRKVTNCFRSQWGAKLYADIRSVLETARRRGIAALQAIRLTLDEIPLPAPP